MHELDNGSVFVTLTYRDAVECDFDQLYRRKFVPDDWSLNKSHFQKFMKRLRKSREPDRIRFFAAGEYGRKCKHRIDLDNVGCPLCNVGRPHFHACLFNVSFADLEAYQTDGNQTRYTSPELEKIWGYGFVDVGELNFQTAAYTARYCVKKVTGQKADWWYNTVDMDGVITFLQPEFVLMSQGIGRGWFEKYFKDVFPSDEVPVVGKGVIRGVPRYYEDLYKEVFPEAFEEVKRLRQEFRKAHHADYSEQRLEAAYLRMKHDEKTRKKRN